MKLKTQKITPSELPDYSLLSPASLCKSINLSADVLSREVSSTDLEQLPSNIIDTIFIEGGAKDIHGSLYACLQNELGCDRIAYAPTINITEDFGPIGLGIKLEEDFAKRFRQAVTEDYNSKARYHHNKHNKGKTCNKHGEHMLLEYATSVLLINNAVLCGDYLWKTADMYDDQRDEENRYSPGRRKYERDLDEAIKKAYDLYLKEDIDITVPDSYIRTKVTAVSAENLCIAQLKQRTSNHLHGAYSNINAFPDDVIVPNGDAAAQTMILFDTEDIALKFLESADYRQLSDQLRYHMAGKISHLGHLSIPRRQIANREPDITGLAAVQGEFDFYMNYGYIWNPRFTRYYAISDNKHRAIARFAVALATNLNSYYNICYEIAEQLVQSDKHPMYELTSRGKTIYLIPKVLHHKACDVLYKLLESTFNIVDIKVIQHEARSI